MNSFLHGAIVSFLVLIVPGTLSAEHEHIQVVGASTILPIVKDVSKAYFQMTGIRVDVKGGGSSVGIRATLEGTVDIGMVSRPLTPEEAKELQAHLVGYDGIALILNEAIPLNKIARQHVVNIYCGAITNWKVLGGEDMEITVISKEEGRSTRGLFDQFFSIPKVVPTAQFVGSNTEAIILVAGDPTAIGYVSIGSAENAVQLGLKLKILPLDGVAATSKSVANRQYPLLRPLNLVTLGKPSEDARYFIQFLRSKKGQAFVKKNNCVALSKDGERE